MIKEADVAVIGGGPAGYTAAIRAAQLGARVALVEKHRLGGACTNYACIPTKFLRRSVDILASIQDASRYGINASLAGLDWVRLQERKQAVIGMLGEGLSGLMAANSIEVIHGQARLDSPGMVAVTADSGQENSIRAKSTILATGSVPVPLNVPGADEAGILFSRDVLELKSLPQSLVIVGGGAVGVEFAVIFSRLGCSLSLVEVMPHILPGEDVELTSMLERALKKEDIKLYTGATINRLESGANGKRVFISAGGQEKTLEAEAIVVAIGQHPYLEGLWLVEAGVRFDAHGISVDERMATSVPGIYAAGDACGKAMLAYVASAQGRVAAENALGVSSAMDYQAIPRFTGSRPELASVGLTESEARAQGYQVKCGRFPFAANAAATIIGQRQGLVKVVAEAASGRVLGVHILGPGASGLIAEASLAVRTRATLKDIANTLHAHPTLSEAFWEAALDADGCSINFKR